MVSVGHPDIVLVEINDATIRDLKEIAGRWPWPRALSATLVDYLHRGAPKVIAVDIGFWEKEREASYSFNGEDYTSARSDGELAEAVRRAGNVVLLADTVDTGLVGREVPQQEWAAPPYRLGEEVEERPVITLPYDVLAAAAAGFGHNFLAISLVTVRRGGSRHSCATAAGSCHRSAWLLRSLPAAIVPRMLFWRAGPFESGTGVCRSFACRSGTPSIRKRHDQDTMLINYRAPVQTRGARLYPTITRFGSCCNRKGSCATEKSRLSTPQSSKTRSCSSASPHQVSSTCFRPRLAGE